MNTLYAILLSTIAGLSTIIGVIVIFIHIKKENIDKFITFCLAFSISIMIGISVVDLIPESFFTLMISMPYLKGFSIVLISFLSGVGIVLILNKRMNNNKNDLYKLGILNMIALIMHNFPEGIATFMSSYKDIDLGLKLSIAIMLHNIPEGISIAVPIYYATGKKKKAFTRTLLSGLSEPLGAILAYLFLSKYITHTMIAMVLIFVAGIMITLSIHEMLPEALKYRKNKFIYLGFSIGIILLGINFYLF